MFLYILGESKDNLKLDYKNPYIDDYLDDYDINSFFNFYYF